MSWLSNTIKNVANTVTLGATSGFKDNPFKTAVPGLTGGQLDPSGVNDKVVSNNPSLQEGVARYNAFLGPEAVQSMMDQRSQAKKEISDSYRDQQRGLNAQQHQSARANYESALRSSGASQRSSLASALASRGLQGGFAAAQSAGLESNLANQMNQAGNELMMQNVSLQRQGLDNYANIVSQQEAEARQNLLNRLTLAVGQKGASGLLNYNPNAVVA